MTHITVCEKKELLIIYQICISKLKNSTYISE